MKWLSLAMGQVRGFINNAEPTAYENEVLIYNQISDVIGYELYQIIQSLGKEHPEYGTVMNLLLESNSVACKFHK